MCLDGTAGVAVDWQYVLRACRKGDDQIHFGAEKDIAARQTRWRCSKLQSTGLIAGNVHEKIEWAWHVRAGEIQLSQCQSKIVRAIVVVARNTQKGIPIAIAGGDQRVMNAAGCVFDDGQHRTPPVAA